MNGSRWRKDRPPFPLLQPEKVLSLPLQLRFDDGYRYRLDGHERVAGYDCYVVRFEPVRNDAALYRGTVWIDDKSFARIRVQAVQGGLPAPVVSNEEIQQYSPPVMVEAQPVFLFTAYGPADHDDRGPKHPGREERGVRGCPRQRRRVRGRAARGAGERPDHVPETDARAALLTPNRATRGSSAIGRRRASRRWRWA